jgi:hypothetical protein
VSTMPSAFVAFLLKHGTSPGLILIPQGLPIGRAIEEMILIWSTSEAHEWRDRMIWLPL